MAKSGRIALLIIVIGAFVTLFFVWRQRKAGEPQQAQLGVVASPLDAKRCLVEVTVDRPPGDVELIVSVDAASGIQFVRSNEPAATSDVGGIFPEGARTVTFDCFLTEKIHRSGAYVVKAMARLEYPSAVNDAKQLLGRSILYVKQENGDNAFVEQEEYEQQINRAFLSGEYYHYRVELEDGDQPKTGSLHVRIDGKKDGFSPIFYVNVDGGVVFLEPVRKDRLLKVDDKLVQIQTDPINSGGSRIVTIPFTMASGADPGIYGFKVLQGDPGRNPGEMTPIYIQVTASPEAPDNKWLVLDERGSAIPLTPVPTRR